MKFAALGPRFLMVSRPCFKTGIRHSEGFYCPVHHPMKVHFANIAVVCVDDPIGVVDAFDAIKGSDFGFDGDPLINRSHPSGLSFEVLVKLIPTYILFGFSETQSHACSETNIAAACFLFNDIPDGSKHLGIRLSAKKCEAVMRREDVHLVLGFDFTHVHVTQGLLRYGVALPRFPRPTERLQTASPGIAREVSRKSSPEAHTPWFLQAKDLSHTATAEVRLG